MPKYVAKRKDVCAGQLLKMKKKIYKAFKEFDNDSNKQYLEIQGVAGLPVSGAIICRGMLFNVDRIGLANDLIYTTPVNYPIYGIPPKVDIESEFVINNYVELDDLLIYLKYGVDLTQKDLDEIYISLITCNSWLRSNMELFGWKKIIKVIVIVRFKLSQCLFTII